MSFWTDIRDTVTAPFRAVGGLVSDLASGKNVFESLTQFGGKELSAFVGPTALLIDKTPLKVVLKNDTVNSLTLGITGHIADKAHYDNQVNLEGKKVTWTDFRDNQITQAKDAAIVGAAVLTGGAAAGVVGTAGAIGAGYAAAKGSSSFLNTGDPSGLLAIAGGASGIPGLDAALPEGFSDAFSTAKDFYNQANAAKDDAEDLYSRFARNAPVTSSGYSSDISGYDDPYSSGSSSGSEALILMAGIGLAAFLLLRRHGNA